METFVTVKNGAFAVGKQVRDILWPANFFVLSLQFATDHHVEVDEHGGRTLRENDLLHVRYATFNEHHTENELLAIVGDQPLEKKIIVDA